MSSVRTGVPRFAHPLSSHHAILFFFALAPPAEPIVDLVHKYFRLTPPPSRHYHCTSHQHKAIRQLPLPLHTTLSALRSPQPVCGHINDSLPPHPITSTTTTPLQGCTQAVHTVHNAGSFADPPQPQRP
ncbi:hypothetical protein FN846DRAFT_58367 [Sphaerosporella brunnea]|uniref:Uncharacterized protein n=1 Tax=Sphaerosporella brunnea TaxID=1250544 RepID=A0A5J5F998_9PEZI|nr:hypothetical protein FN846DRAFT_58367 [Sphaerosporella brunnea]